MNHLKKLLIAAALGTLATQAPAAPTYKFRVSSKGIVAAVGNITPAAPEAPATDGGTPQPTVPAPIITSAAFDSPTGTYGQWNEFGWAATNATSVRVTCQGASEIVEGDPTATSGVLYVDNVNEGTTQCTVQATNAGGTSSQSATMQVFPHAGVSSAFFTPPTVTRGGQATLTWSAYGATRVTISCDELNVDQTFTNGASSMVITTPSNFAGQADCRVFAVNGANYGGSKWVTLTVQ
jgi:hypothetical protein